MKTTFNTALLGSLMFATVTSGRQIRGTNDQQQASTITSMTDSLLSWIRRDQEVDVEPAVAAAEDGEQQDTVTSPLFGKRSEVRARPEINESGLSHLFDEFRNWEGPTAEEKAAAKAEKAAAKADKRTPEEKAAAKAEKAESKEKEGANETEQEGAAGEKKQGDGTGKKWMKAKVTTVGGDEATRRRELRSAEAYARGAQSRGRHEGVGNINFWRKSGLNKFRNEDRRRLAMS